jgi:hypothetical protein
MTDTNDLATAIAAVNAGKQVTLASTPPIQFNWNAGQQLQQGSWGYHDGGTNGIGGVATRSHVTSQQKDGSQLFSITGPYKATGLWYLSVPTTGWQSGQHTLSCDYMYISGPDGMDEFDGRLTDANGFGENCSTACVWKYPDVAPPNTLVVSGPKGEWEATKFNPTAFPAGVWVHRATVMEFDFSNETFGIVSVQAGTNTYPIGQNFKALPTNWTRNQMLIQVQIYCSADTGNGLPLSVAVNNLSLA